LVLKLELHLARQITDQ